MKQINVCLDRFFNQQKPLKTKWQAVEHPERADVVCLFHYHHLVLVYDVKKHIILKKWWELPADKRGLDAALHYFEEKKTKEK